MFGGETVIYTGMHHNVSGKQEICGRQEVFIRMVSSEFTSIPVCGCVHSLVCVCIYELQSTSLCVCWSVLVVSQYARMLLTPLTPYKTRLNATDQGPADGWRSEVR